MVLFCKFRFLLIIPRGRKNVLFHVLSFLESLDAPSDPESASVSSGLSEAAVIRFISSWFCLALRATRTAGIAPSTPAIIPPSASTPAPLATVVAHCRGESFTSSLRSLVNWVQWWGKTS